MAKDKNLKRFKVKLTLTRNSEPLEIDALDPEDAYKKVWSKIEKDPNYWLGWDLIGEVDPVKESQDDKKES